MSGESSGSYESCGSGWDEGPAGFGGSSLSCGFCGSGGLGGLDESTWLGGSGWYWVPSWANSGYFLPISSDAIEF